MKKAIGYANELIDFIYNSPTAFHAVDSIKEILLKNDFKEVKEEDRWNLEKGGKYFVNKYDSALIAFVVGEGEIEKDGFKIIGSHTDSPTFKIKPQAEMISENAYVKLNTEVYGGPILNTWMDRPLSIAGRVMIKGDNPFNVKTQLINIKRPILTIPNLAIHMNRNVNLGVELNKQKDTLPLLTMVKESFEKGQCLLNIVSEEIKVSKEKIVDFDLFLYEFEKGCLVGLDEELISSSRQDDLSMVHASLNAIINTKAKKGINVAVFFDNEEIGSSTKQGAGSPFLINILERIALSFKKDREDFLRSITKSFMISADLAHAVHPNSGEKSDPMVRPIINKGPVIKVAASGSYTSDCYSKGIYEQICKNAKVPYQVFVNRSDEKGGSTIGPISSTHLNIPSVDMGSPILAMHSIRELGGVLDHSYVTRSFEEFYKI